MTRKDYVKFAALFAGELSMARSFSQAEVRVAAAVAVGSIIASTADIFAADNPAFDRDRFYTACGF